MAKYWPNDLAVWSHWLGEMNWHYAFISSFDLWAETRQHILGEVWERPQEAEGFRSNWQPHEQKTGEADKLFRRPVGLMQVLLKRQNTRDQYCKTLSFCCFLNGPLLHSFVVLSNQTMQFLQQINVILESGSGIRTQGLLIVSFCP